MATFIVEMLVGAENRSLTMREHDNGVTSIDPRPLEPLVGRENSRRIATELLTNILMGDVEWDGKKIGWLAWTASYIEGSAIGDAVAEYEHNLSKLSKGV